MMLPCIPFSSFLTTPFSPLPLSFYSFLSSFLHLFLPSFSFLFYFFLSSWLAIYAVHFGLGSVLTLSSFASRLFTILPVGFFGSKGHMPRWLGGGFLLFNVGTLLFGLAHVLNPSTPSGAMAIFVSSQVSCSSSCSFLCSWAPSFDLCSLFKVVAGFGGASLFALAPVYIVDNSTQRSAPLYLGIMYASGAVAAALGFILGGLFVGQWEWWKGFLLMFAIGTACCFILSLSLFPPSFFFFLLVILTVSSSSFFLFLPF